VLKAVTVTQKITPWSLIHPGKLVKEFLIFMETEGSLLLLLESAIGFYPEPVKSSPEPHILFL
jgi:hypothetical protein